MNLIKMAEQLLHIHEDLRYAIGDNYPFIKYYKICDFDQTWENTALGFGGFGRSALTTERTYVIYAASPYDNIGPAFVYFGETFAYKIDNPNELFEEDLKNHRMASVMESGKYEMGDQ